MPIIQIHVEDKSQMLACVIGFFVQCDKGIRERGLHLLINCILNIFFNYYPRKKRSATHVKLLLLVKQP